VDAALFQHLSRKMKETHQPGFACSAAGLFPFPFGGPFDGPLPGPFAGPFAGAWTMCNLGSNGFKWDLIFAESFQEQGQIALRFT
jgi:hypothetical protein